MPINKILNKINKFVSQKKPIFLGKKENLRGLDTYVDKKKIYLSFQSSNDDKKSYRIAVSDDGLNFSLYSKDNTFSKLPKKTKQKKLIWGKNKLWGDKNVYLIDVIELDGKTFSYWGVKNEGIYAVIHPCSFSEFSKSLKHNPPTLNKSHKNPIISPKSKNDWEAFNTFNPAAVYENSKVHIVYRAQGYDYVSSLGYAVSKDGIHIEERLDKPIFQFDEIPKCTSHRNKVNYLYVSGGGFGGCEDPRITKIDNKFYMTYVAFDGINPPRVALTSILIKDFLNRRWLWSKPVMISPPGVVDKSACIFPEKIKGKYVILHRIFPNILVDFVDDLNFDGSRWLKGEYSIKIREDMWDSRKIGAGAPPVKTKDGWLLIYYGVDEKDLGKYKIGAMLLDLKNPTHVLHRTNQPILEPTHRYENEGFKPGIAYPCGVIVINDTLFVYYGAADSVVCVATINLQNFLNQLKSKEAVNLDNAQIHSISLPC